MSSSVNPLSLKSNSVVVATSYFCPAIVTKPREPYSGSLLELDDELDELLELDEELLDIDEDVLEVDFDEDELLDESPSGFASPQPVRSAAARIAAKIVAFFIKTLLKANIFLL